MDKDDELRVQSLAGANDDVALMNQSILRMKEKAMTSYDV